ncbi:MAG: glycosyltransferase [Bacteroidetes bacterium]|nr:glycosyltransferase [Bacteroidota bacterium]
MERQRDIIIVGIQPWDIQIGSNCKNMALELSKHHRVLYVNAPLDRSTANKEKNNPSVKRRMDVINRKKASLMPVSNNLWEFNPPIQIESINWLPSPLFTIANKFNNKRFAKAIAKAARELGFENYYLLNDSDMFRSFYLKEYLRPKKYIYYTRDNLMTVPYWKKHGRSMEPLLMSKSDVVVGNSPFLIEYAKQYNSNATYIGQGCDVSAFSTNQPFEKPKDLQNIKGKIIGYTGLLSSRRLDIQLIADIAKSHPEWNIVLVGMEEENFQKSHLHNLENCFFLGNKSPESLPSYINYFDVCINPQIVNELTEANYPRKIDEYLAMGKPTVATYTPTMEIFSGYASLARSSEEYIQMIEQALSETDSTLASKRKAFAQSHTWQACIESFWKAVKK